MLGNINLGVKSAPTIHLIEVVKNLKKEKHDVIVFVHNTERYYQDMPEIKYIPILNISGIRFYMFDFFSCIYILIYYLKFKPDAVYIRYGLLSLSTIVSRILRLPCVVEINSIPFDEARLVKKQNYLFYAIKFIAMYPDWRISCKFSDKIVVVTDGIKKEIHKKYKLHSDKIVVIPNGANTDLFKPMDKEKVKKELNFDKNTHYVCFVGNLAPWQGVECLIQSAPSILEEIPNTKFLVVGDGVIKEKLIKIAEKTGVSNEFIFTCSVPYEEVPKYINTSDVCVVPCIRKRNEKIGLSALKAYEYLSCGRTTVVSNIKGISDLIVNSNSGIVVEPENPKELSKAIIKLIKDEKLRGEMGRNGREYVIKYHTWKNVARRVAEVCKNVVNNKK